MVSQLETAGLRRGRHGHRERSGRRVRVQVGRGTRDRRRADRERAPAGRIATLRSGISPLAKNVRLAARRIPLASRASST